MPGCLQSSIPVKHKTPVFRGKCLYLWSGPPFLQHYRPNFSLAPPLFPHDPIVKDSARLRRQLCLLRLLERPSTYPSLSDICNHLRGKDFSQVSAPTVERDLSDIRSQYGLAVTFDRRKGGYCLDLPTEADVDDFVQYVRLLERSLRIETLAKPGVAVGRYLQLERHDGFRGLDLLEPLWNALHLQRVVGFHYQPYPQEGTVRDGQRWRSVEPGLLFEYRNRWYLDGFDLETGKGHRTCSNTCSLPAMRPQTFRNMTTIK